MGRGGIIIIGWLDWNPAGGTAATPAGTAAIPGDTGVIPGITE